MSYYIDQVIFGVQDYLATKGLAIDPMALNDPDFYHSFENDPSQWNIGPYLISIDGSDVMSNPTYLALNPHLMENQGVPPVTPQLTLIPGLANDPSLIGRLFLANDPSLIGHLLNDRNAEMERVLNHVAHFANMDGLVNFLDTQSLNPTSDPQSTGANTEEGATPKTTDTPQNNQDDTPKVEEPTTQPTETNTDEGNSSETTDDTPQNNQDDTPKVEEPTPQSTGANTEEGATPKTTDTPQNNQDDTPKVEEPTPQSTGANTEEGATPETTDTPQNNQDDTPKVEETTTQPTETNTDEGNSSETTDDTPQNNQDDTPKVEETTTQPTETNTDDGNSSETTDAPQNNQDDTNERVFSISINELNDSIRKLKEAKNNRDNQQTETIVDSDNLNEDNESEILQAVKNFSQRMYDFENGFNVLVTDSEGNPSQLYYVEENGVYYRADDTSKTPLDLTKAQFKLTENQYQSYLKQLNKQENQRDNESEEVFVDMDAQLVQPQTAQDGLSQREVHEPQSHQPNQNSVDPALNPASHQQPVTTQNQARELTPEQAQAQQQAQLQAQAEAQRQALAEQQRKEDEKANFLVKTGRWIQENVFDNIGNAIPIPLVGTGIKMIGNVFTGLLKTIGHLFDGNWKKMASDGFSWFKDTAIVGGATFGVYKLGKELDWWGKDKTKTVASSVSTDKVSAEQVANLAQKAVTTQSGVLASAVTPEPTMVLAQKSDVTEVGVSNALRKTASIPSENEQITDIITQNTKTLG